MEAAEEALEAEASDGLRGVGERDACEGFDRLVQALLPCALGHGTASEFVDDHHLVVLDEVLFAFLIELAGDEGLGNEFEPASGSLPEAGETGAALVELAGALACNGR